ncbi:MAG: MotA/TolQ/ExbB proton channel family protein, partial [Pseudomonadota bacterium]|nr:MotA/TolQ/ExbB proton channel family protein [Pseudomonadota bacterium]
MIRQYILPSLALAAPAAAEAATDGAALPADLSVWGMFAQADWVVKLVMLGLVVASIVTWTVLVAKHLELARQRKDTEAFRDRLAATRSLAQLDGTALQHPIVQEAREELAQSDGSLADGEGLKERLVSRLDRYEAKVARKMTQGVTILGTIGATAPFVGLFGTVWGIMNSFIGI